MWLKYLSITWNDLDINHQWFLLLFLLFCCFYLTPGLDIWTSSLFYQSSAHKWFGNDTTWVSVVYWTFKYSGVFYLLLLVGCILFAKIKNYQKLMRASVYSLVVLIVGILIIEEALKNNWGRARPRDIIEFGGSLYYTEFWQQSTQCLRNCSFSSGHSAAGFYLFILGFIFKKNIWFLPGLIFGVLLSYTRVSMGGHFLSDVIVSGFVMYGLAWLFSFIISSKNRVGEQHPQLSNALNN